jgi:hypothetical protein
LTEENVDKFNKQVLGTTSSIGDPAISPTGAVRGFALKTKEVDDLPLDPDRDIEGELAEDRQSSIPELDQYLYYADGLDMAPTHTGIKELFREIRKDPKLTNDEGYAGLFHDRWTNVPRHTAIRPGYSEALPLEQYPAAAVAALGVRLRPGRRALGMPRLAVALPYQGWGGDGDDDDAARLGAAMVEGAWEQHRYLGGRATDFLGETQALTGVFDGRALRIFENYAVAHRSALAVDGKYPNKLVFRQKLLKDIDVSTMDGYLEARRSFRNAQDWAREKVLAVRDALARAVEGKTGWAPVYVMENNVKESRLTNWRGSAGRHGQGWRGTEGQNRARRRHQARCQHGIEAYNQAQGQQDVVTVVKQSVAGGAFVLAAGLLLRIAIDLASQ